MAAFHPSAIIDPAAEIDPTADIGPNCVIDGPVKIGPRTKMLGNCFVTGETVIGADNVLTVGVVIGTDPQHLAYKGAPTKTIVGDGNTFREYVTVHRPYEAEGETRIGNGCFFMACSHVAHDCFIGDGVIMANGCLLGGHSKIMAGAVLSGNACVHQFARVGQLAMISGLTRVTKDVPPFMVAMGNCCIYGPNAVGLRRAGFNPETRLKIKQAYRILYRDGLSMADALTRIREELGDCEAARTILDFIASSKRGISRHSPGVGAEDDDLG